MSKVNIQFSTEQFKELIKLIYIGDWVIDDAENIMLNDMVQQIFSKAEEAGLKSMIEYNNDLNLFMPTADLDEEVVEVIDGYEQECFWDHLIYSLAERDIEQELKEKFKHISDEEKLELIEKYSKKYEKEFESNGVENLIIK